MKKLILALTIAALSFTATAEKAITEGFYKSNGFGYIVWDSDEDIGLMIGFTEKGKVLPMFLSPDDDCNDYDGATKKAQSSTINDVVVRMKSQCFLDGYTAFSAYSKRGNRYIINELKTKGTLNIDGFTFNTTGFIKNLELAQSKREGL